MQRPVHPSFGRVKHIVGGQKYGWTGKNIREQSSKTIDFVNYASKVRVNGVTCVFVVHLRSSDTFKVSKLAKQFTVYTKTLCHWQKCGPCLRFDAMAFFVMSIFVPFFIPVVVF